MSHHSCTRLSLLAGLFPSYIWVCLLYPAHLLLGSAVPLLAPSVSARRRLGRRRHSHSRQRCSFHCLKSCPWTSRIALAIAKQRARDGGKCYRPQHGAQPPSPSTHAPPSLRSQRRKCKHRRRMLPHNGRRQNFKRCRRPASALRRGPPSPQAAPGLATKLGA